ncbi:MAG TPA: hypothetical protein VMG82_34880 [Candidatus Sulfotelmatobacter sp.]|nr:hypothetical protein [Candidatus Sulfotelmatobacter sp.]
MFRPHMLSLLLAATFCSAQNANNPISCELSNNTSASPRYRGGRANAAPSNVSKLPIRSLLYQGSNARIFTRYMPWFGDPKHRDVGYRSDDREQISGQVADMVSRGIQGAIVDWYGPDSDAKNESTLLVMKEAERQNFGFAVSEDAGALGDCAKHGCNVTDQLIRDLQYAAEHFENSSAYIRFNNRPAVFFFGVEKYPIDWKHVRHSLPLSPLFFFRNSGSFANDDADGAYSWIAPETAASTDAMALQYLVRFYSKAQQSNKIAMGSAYKGFDDADASWGKGRVIDQRCGQTWLSTFEVAGRFYSTSHQLPALIIPTWNDYEEGTEIETGIDNCVEVKASIRGGDTLVWNISGRENTIDHIAVLQQQSAGWSKIAKFPPAQHSVSLQDLHVSTGTANLCVVAVGKPSMLNHSSGPITVQNQK